MRTVVTTLVGILVQLGLAVLGWGGFAAFFAHPPLLALTVATLVITVVALFSEGNLSPGEHEDRGNRWVIAAISALAIFLAYFPAYTDRRNLWTIDGETLRWTGLVVFVLGCVLRLWPVFVLGRRFSGLVAIQKDHKLVTTGIYRYVRNPSYLGLLVSSLGWALTFRSGIGVLIALLLLIPLLARMRAEERLLCGLLRRRIRELSGTDLAAHPRPLLTEAHVLGRLPERHAGPSLFTLSCVSSLSRWRCGTFPRTARWLWSASPCS